MSDERLGTLQQVLEQRHAIIMELVETCGIHKAAKRAVGSRYAYICPLEATSADPR